MRLILASIIVLFASMVHAASPATDGAHLRDMRNAALLTLVLNDGCEIDDAPIESLLLETISHIDLKSLRSEQRSAAQYDRRTDPAERFVQEFAMAAASDDGAARQPNFVLALISGTERFGYCQILTDFRILHVTNYRNQNRGGDMMHIVSLGSWNWADIAKPADAQSSALINAEIAAQLFNAFWLEHNEDAARGRPASSASGGRQSSTSAKDILTGR